MKLIEAYNAAVTSIETLAGVMLERYAHYDSEMGDANTETEVVGEIVDEIILACLNGEGFVDEKSKKPRWTLIGDALVCAGFEWKVVYGGVKLAFQTYFPKEDWSGGFLQAVKAPDKPKRKSSGQKWSTVGNKAKSLRESIKGMKKGSKAFAEAQAEVELLAIAMGLKVEA